MTDDTGLQLYMTSPTTPRRQVIVCNHQTCHQQGAEAVVQTLQATLPETVELVVRQCLGQCGSGPMVLVLPEQIWYNQVQPQDVPRIVRQHLGQGEPGKDKLYRRFHPDRVKSASQLWVWAVVGLGLLSMVGLLVVGIGWAW